MPEWLMLLLGSLALIIVSELATKKLEALLTKKQSHENTSSNQPASEATDEFSSGKTN